MQNLFHLYPHLQHHHHQWIMTVLLRNIWLSERELCHQEPGARQNHQLKRASHGPNINDNLIIGKIAVGTAVLSEWPSRSLSRKFHGQPISGSPVQHLVTVNNINIVSNMSLLPYSYHCLGPESSPSSLKYLYRSGVYLWDLNNVENLNVYIFFHNA